MSKRSFYDEQVREQLMLVARNIRALRLSRGVSQDALAEALGTTQAYLSKVEKGSVIPGLGMLVSLAMALDSTLQDLVSQTLVDRLPNPVRSPKKRKTPPDQAV